MSADPNEKPDILRVLDHYGIEHHGAEGNTRSARSFFRDDHNPSLIIMPDFNRWEDAATGHKGDSWDAIAHFEVLDVRTDFIRLREIAEEKGFFASNKNGSANGARKADAPLWRWKTAEIAEREFGKLSLARDDAEAAEYFLDAYSLPSESIPDAVRVGFHRPDGNGDDLRGTITRLGLPGSSAVRFVFRSFDRDAKGKRFARVLHGRGPGGFFPAADAAGFVLTGGFEKAIAATLAGFNGISLPVGENQAKRELIDWIAANCAEGPIIVASDNDKAGRTANAKAAESLIEAGIDAEKVRLIQWPNGVKERFDLNDALKERGPEGLRELLRSAPRYNPAVVEVSPDIPTENDIGNARRYAREHADCLLYDYSRGSWLHYDGRRWREDDTGEAERRAKQTADRLWTEAGRITSRKERDRAAAHALRTMSARAISAMLALARSELAVRPDGFDADPMLFNCMNGTLVLKTGELRPHHRDDFITKLSPVEFDPDAEAPTWIAFLNRVFDSNATLIDFIRRWSGYCLTGHTSEHRLLFAHGGGRNGKTTLIEALQFALGDYAVTVESDLLMAKKTQSHTTGLTDLRGARLAVSPETESGARLAEVQVKSLTGGDRITARRMRENNVTWTPTHKLVQIGNHRPRIRGTDEGIWSRICLLPFTVTIPGRERDSKLTDKLRAEASGVLAWAMRGCLEWQERGLDEPDVVKAATSSYRESSDSLAPFIAERLVVIPGGSVTVKNLFTAYRLWCDDAKETPLGKVTFNELLRERGFKDRKGTGNIQTWIDLELTDPAGKTMESRAESFRNSADSLPD